MGLDRVRDACGMATATMPEHAGGNATLLWHSVQAVAGLELMTDAV